MLAKYLISSPSAAMVVPDGDWEYGGPRLARGDRRRPLASTSSARHRRSRATRARFGRRRGRRKWLPMGAPARWQLTVLELPSREEGVAWAARIAKACRCDQELRVFQFDPTVLKAARPRAQRWLPSSRLSFRSVAADDKPGSRPSPMNFHGRSEALTKVGLS